MTSVGTIGRENGRFILEHSVLFSKIVPTYGGLLRGIFEAKSVENGLVEL